ncbi:imelysin family protein [Xinfangfangia pollutisoli]|uniref:imelysin family protein n=1 Tax=Xinfangfangia pollutisoli TaxID=2865960 RepID=UPI001CD4A563|nr:imelysin family protein [Xinfangfangia pollutisoli]
MTIRIRLAVLACFLAAGGALALGAGPARADYPEAVRQTLLPGYADFRAATADLAAKAAETCDPAALAAPFNAAWDAWLEVQWLRLGPAEDQGRALAIAFWPDPKGMGAKAQKALIGADPALLAPEAFAQQSVAARGFFSLERLLYPATPLAADTCPLIRATADDLARMAAAIETDWTGSYADVMLTAGAPGNATFLTESEVRQALFTQIATGLEFIKDQRIGRPLGTFDKPRPELAEARASGRSLRNVLVSLQALRAMTETLSPNAPQTLAAFDHAIQLAQALDDPDFSGIADPSGWLKLQILQQAVDATRQKALSELARDLGVDLGFNAADGD